MLSRLTSIWSPNTVPLDSYDDALPRNIPFQCDIDIGNAFKDHPVLFLIFEKYTSVQNQHYSSSAANEIVRSILVYFIVFWHMKEVVNSPTALRFATQLEETTRLILLLKPVSERARCHNVFALTACIALGFTSVFGRCLSGASIHVCKGFGRYLVSSDMVLFAFASSD